MRGHVAGAARIVVVAPTAADIAGLLENDEGGPPRFEKLDHHAEARKTRTDDGDIMIRFGGDRAFHGNIHARGSSSGGKDPL